MGLIGLISRNGDKIKVVMKIKDLILKTEKIDWQNIKDLQPVNLKNNYHSDKTKNSIIKNGFARAIYVWQDKKGDIYTVDGHLRADILRELKNDGYDIPNQLNCTFLDLPNKKTAIKYLLQVFNQKTNPINQENMEIWLDDNEIVLDDMEIELDELHIELNDELEDEEEQEEVKEDEVPEVKHSFVVKGDLFELVDEEQGLNHRVLCGDSTMIDDVEKVMNGEKADMVFTDPPYGIGLDKDNQTLGKSQQYKGVLNDKDNTVAIDVFNLCQSINISIQFFWGANHYASCLPDSSCWLVWDKQGGKSVTYADCELCYTNLNSPVRMFTHIWDGFRKDSEKGEKRVHPTQKPIKLFSEIWDKFDCPNKVIDFFLGSGSTLIACQQTKRKCYGIELDEHYCGVVITRWKNYMEKEGKKYSIKRNGEQFNLND